MNDILKATGIDASWPTSKGKHDGRPGYATKGVTNQARVRPDWHMKSQARPIFPASTGPYWDPNGTLSGTRQEPVAQWKGASKQTLRDYKHRQGNA